MNPLSCPLLSACLGAAGPLVDVSQISTIPLPPGISTAFSSPPLLPATATVAQETQIWSQTDAQGNTAHT